MAAWNEQEFEEIMTESAGKTLAVIRRFFREEKDAEDVLQDTYLAAWKARESFDGRSSVTTWIHRIAVNTSLNRLKQLNRQRNRLDEEYDTAYLADSRREFEERELREVVWQALDKLPEDQRVVLLLRDVEGFNSEEVASQLEMSSAAVRQRLHRARQYVAELLSPELCGARELTCGGQLDLLFDFIDRALAEEFIEPVTAHVAECETCQSYEVRFREVIALPKETAVSSIEVSDELFERLASAIRST